MNHHFLFLGIILTYIWVNYKRCGLPTAILILALRERNFKGAGLQNFIFPVSQGKTPYP
jgi:hypothetical protein